MFVINDDDLQAVPNGTSFEFVTTENGTVCRDLYSTPQYKLDPPGDGTGELFMKWNNSIKTNENYLKIYILPLFYFDMILVN